MRSTQISIGQAKKDISEIVERVAVGNGQFILTSNDEPKAAIISMENYERLVETEHELRRQEWKKWLAENEKLNERIAQRRRAAGLTEEIDLDEALRTSREDLDRRHDNLIFGLKHDEI